MAKAGLPYLREERRAMDDLVGRGRTLRKALARGRWHTRPAASSRRPAALSWRSSHRRCLTLPSSGRPAAGCACCRSPIISNIERPLFNDQSLNCYFSFGSTAVRHSRLRVAPQPTLNRASTLPGLLRYSLCRPGMLMQATVAASVGSVAAGPAAHELTRAGEPGGLRCCLTTTVKACRTAARARGRVSSPFCLGQVSDSP